MKKSMKILYLSPALLLLAACSVSGSSSDGSNPYLTSSDSSITSSASTSSGSPATSTSTLSVDSSASSSQIANDDPSTITDLSAANIAYADNTFTISGPGTFTFTGNFNGNIVVDAGDDDEVELDLKNFYIASSSNSPIFCKNADSLKIKLQKDTVNYVYDNRSLKSEDDDEQGNGAIYSKCDTKISGKGSLNVNASYNNGIHSTKDLTFKSTVNEGSQIQINAVNTAIKGNDSVSVESGNIIAISSGGDGVKVEDSDISSKGNQRGNFTMSGGQLDIYSCCDGIQASYNAIIENGTDDEGNITTPILNIYTNKYSSYSGEVVDVSTSNIYLKSNEYSPSYRYAILFQKQDGTTSWANATYLTSRSDAGGGGRGFGGRGGSTSYYFEAEKPSDATSLKVYKFASSVSDNDASKAVASMSAFQSINSNFDMMAISVSSSNITSSGWSSYSSSNGQNNPGVWGGGGMGGNMNDGNNDKSDYSAKGIKAENLIEIDAGEINIKSYDDGLHANYGTSLDNGETGLGDVLINGGNLNVYAADDGLHADRYLTIKGGNIDVTNAYEAFEGNYISIAGGYSKVYGSDDGLNAANKAGMNPVIDITGGILDVTVYGNDVDGIDSNGTYKQSGGFVISKGANSNMSTGLDVDSTATISGGTFVCFGNPEKSPTLSNGVSKKSLSGSYSIGDYEVSDGTNTVSVTTKYSYSTVMIYSTSVNSVTISKK